MADTPITTQAIGYRWGLSQPAKPYTLNLTQPDDINYKELDRLLTTHFEVNLVAAKYEKHLSSKKSRAIIQMGWRIMQVSNALMQAARIPAFDPGKIVALKSSGSRQSTLTALLPALDFIDEKIRLASLQVAGAMIGKLARGQPSASVVTDVQEFANERFVKPVMRMFPGDSTVPLLGALYDTRIPFRHLGIGVYQIGWGAHCMLVQRSAFEADSAIGARMSHNKYVTTTTMRAAGLPTPDNALAESAEDAGARAAQLGWPVVVKPLDRDRGEGVSVDLHNDQSVAEAYLHAKEAGGNAQVLVESQVKGVCHRCYVYNGQLLYVSKRLPKSVKGDGQSSVNELIDKANAEEMQKPIWSRLKPFHKDSLALECLRNAGHDLYSIPGENAWAPLRPIQSNQEGGVVEDMTESIHPDNIDIAVRAARLLRLRSAGIDIITEDITRSWRETGAIINEVNYSPMIGRRTPQESGVYLGKLAEHLLPENGRIPVEVFIGGAQAWERGVERQRQLGANQQPSYLSSHGATLGPDGAEMAFDTRGLYPRVLSLLMDQNVQGVVLVIQDNEFEQTGLPVDQFTNLVHVDNEVIVRPHDKPMDRGYVQRFVNLLKMAVKV